MTFNFSEYETFANEWDELVDAECIPNGIYKGLPIDFQIDMNHDQRAVFFAEAIAKRDQEIEDRAINAALAKSSGCLSEAYEDRWPEYTS